MDINKTSANRFDCDEKVRKDRLRKKRLFVNTAGSLTSQFVEVIAGLILPRLLLKAYGSEVYGLTHSIAQFLMAISFLDMGIGRVVETSLYEPLSQRNWEGISRIIVSASHFFRRLGIVLTGYVIVLCFAYPALVKHSFDNTYTVTLLLILSFFSLSQYLFPQTDIRLLSADQRMYVLHGLHILTQTINVVVSVIMISLGYTIHALKLTVTILCLCRPVFLRLYVNRHYQLNRRIQYMGEPIRNKWYGMAQHIEYVVFTNTDYIVLTLFSTLENVSIYAIYHMVLAGIGKIIQGFRDGFLALLGELWARKETKELEDAFSWLEWITHTLTVFLYGCTSMLIVPFVQVYTNGVGDAVYIQPAFAVLMTVACAFECFRTPYNLMILAAGQYKETQKCYIMTALINLSISIFTVWHFGLIGVAVGTVVSLGYQMVWMVRYNIKHLINCKGLVKRVLSDLLMIVVGVGLTFHIRIRTIDYEAWIRMGVLMGLIWAVVIIGFNVILYPEKVKKVIRKIKAVI